MNKSFDIARRNRHAAKLNLELRARELCHLRGLDPDATVMQEDTGGYDVYITHPQWMDMAEELLAHQERVTLFNEG